MKTMKDDLFEVCVVQQEVSDLSQLTDKPLSPVELGTAALGIVVTRRHPS